VKTFLLSAPKEGGAQPLLGLPYPDPAEKTPLSALCLDSSAVAVHRDLEGAQPDRAQPVERLAGRHELRRTGTTWDLATGTLACPGCDAPVLLTREAMSPPDPMSCGFCGHAGAVRDFLSLAEPTRPTRVVVRIHGFALR
jgi:hypothetical protein